MGIEQILVSIQRYGLPSTVGGGLLFGLYLVFKSEWFSKFMTRVSDLVIDRIIKGKTKGEKPAGIITESDILNHDIFSYIDLWMFSKIPTLQFSTEYRTLVFRKYLSIFLKKHKDNILIYVTNKEFETMDESQLWNSLLNLINDIIYDYEKEMEKTGIPKVIIEKMKIKNNDTISLTIDLVSGVCNSGFYKSEKNLLKMYSILNIMLSILENTIFSSEHICNSINGQLKGLSMDGKKEP